MTAALSAVDVAVFVTPMFGTHRGAHLISVEQQPQQFPFVD